MKKTETFQTSSNQLAAFLAAQIFHYRAIKTDTGIKIELSGPGLIAAVENFYQNASIPVQSYLMAFEALRGAVAIAREKAAR